MFGTRLSDSTRPLASDPTDWRRFLRDGALAALAAGALNESGHGLFGMVTVLVVEQ